MLLLPLDSMRSTHQSRMLGKESSAPALTSSIFVSGDRLGDPQGDAVRQAVPALRGYRYQLIASALAWLSLSDGEQLHLEVAEDYAVAAEGALVGTQVRDNAASGSLTLRSKGVGAAIDGLAKLHSLNRTRRVTINYLTTAEIGLERDRIDGIEGPALLYWRRSLVSGDVSPLRKAILALGLKPETRDWIEGLNDQKFRVEMLGGIHWLSGAPDISNMRDELEAGLIEYVASNRGLNSRAGRDMVAPVLEKVFSTATSSATRVLRRADLLTLIDADSTVTISKASLRYSDTGSVYGRPSVLIPMTELPLRGMYTRRPALIRKIAETCSLTGLSVLVGGTGTGKSLAARFAAENIGGDWAVADFRDLSAEATRARLEQAFGELGVTPAAGIILDDLNEADSPIVRQALGRLLASQARRQMPVLCTAYLAPAQHESLGRTGTGSPVVTVDYFDVDEVGDLVAMMGGETKFAGAIHRAAENGHPQITMATVATLAQQGWSRSSLASLLGGNDKFGTEADRISARKRLVDSTTAEARSLVLRTSIIHGSFDRTTALSLSDLVPKIPLPGLQLDALIGPWIEMTAYSRMRVSPLLKGAADEVFSLGELGELHRRIAEQLLLRTSLNMLDTDAIVYHGLRSGSGDLISSLALQILSAPTETQDQIAAYATDLVLLPVGVRLDGLGQKEALYLRAAQALLAVARENAPQAIACFNVVVEEATAMRVGDHFMTMFLTKILFNLKSGLVFDDWLEKLKSLHQLLQQAPVLSSKREADGADLPGLLGVLFTGQMTTIGSVRQLHEIIVALDRSGAEFRDAALGAFDHDGSDVGLLVTMGWMREVRSGDFDWRGAAAHYAACALIAGRWQRLDLARRCKVAESVCYDESGHESDRALEVLAEAETLFGVDVSTIRARARIFWRRKEHGKALPLLSTAAEDGGLGEVEQTYIAREAGISAAELGRWSEAADWFLKASELAKRVELSDMRALSAGLSADAALARFVAGSAREGVVLMLSAIGALDLVDANGSDIEAYCHRVVRHAALWLYCEIKAPGGANDLGLAFVPGMCSNPDPLPAVRELPLGDIDMAYYLMAQADTFLDRPTGIQAEVYGRLKRGPILAQEISFQIRKTELLFIDHNGADFLATLPIAIGAAESIARTAGDYEDLSNPLRGTIQPAVLDDTAEDDSLGMAVDLVLAFCLRAAVDGELACIDTVVQGGLASAHLAGLHDTLRAIQQGVPTISTLEIGLANALHLMRRDDNLAPDQLLMAQIWAVLFSKSSRSGPWVRDAVLDWIFAAWEEMCGKSRFRLRQPAINCQPIEDALLEASRSYPSVVRLLKAAGPAAGLVIPKQLLQELNHLSNLDADPRL